MGEQRVDQLIVVHDLLVEGNLRGLARGDRTDELADLLVRLGSEDVQCGHVDTLLKRYDEIVLGEQAPCFLE